MFTEKHFPTSLSGEELDDYLSRGWYRLGQNVFTCHFLFFEDALYSPVWIRLPLKGFTFRKRLRKLIRKCESRFTTRIGKAVIDQQRERLYRKYRHNFRGRLSPSLKNSLLDDQDDNIFDTWEAAVYHGKKLIAISYFDLGKTSIASIKGVYDPAYSNYSLGLYTMTKEIEFGLENGYDYYYPGYIVPGFPRFDYKLRIGRKDIEFYDLKKKSWLDYDNFSDQNIPVELLSKKLVELGWRLSEVNIACQMLYYPAYEANIFGYENERFLESPLFLNCFNNVFPRPRFIIFYDLWKEKYVFCHCIPYEDLGFYFEYSMQFDTLDARHFLDFILKKSQIIETDDIRQIVSLAENISILLKEPPKRGYLK